MIKKISLLNPNHKHYKVAPQINKEPHLMTEKGWLYTLLDSQSNDIVCPKLQQVQINILMRYYTTVKRFIAELYGFTNIDITQIQNTIAFIQLQFDFTPDRWSHLYKNIALDQQHLSVQYDVNETQLIILMTSTLSLTEEITHISDWLKRLYIHLNQSSQTSEEYIRNVILVFNGTYNNNINPSEPLVHQYTQPDFLAFRCCKHDRDIFATPPSPSSDSESPPLIH